LTVISQLCIFKGALANASAAAPRATGTGLGPGCSGRGGLGPHRRRAQTVAGQHGNHAVEEQVRRRGHSAPGGGRGTQVRLHFCAFLGEIDKISFQETHDPETGRVRGANRDHAAKDFAVGEGQESSAVRGRGAHCGSGEGTLKNGYKKYTFTTRIYCFQAQNNIAILERAKEQLEKLVSDLKIRIDELNVELEAAVREARAAQAELQKMKHLYEKAIEQKEALARENKKLQGKILQVAYHAKYYTTYLLNVK